FIASRTASTAVSALTFVMSAALETSLMMSTLIMGMDLLLSDTYYRSSWKSLSNLEIHDSHPEDRARGPPQRGQVHAVQPDLRPSQGAPRRPSGLDARSELCPGLLAGGGLRADRHGRAAARERRPAPRPRNRAGPARHPGGRPGAAHRRRPRGAAPRRPGH